jgi:hypothetical protein
MRRSTRRYLFATSLVLGTLGLSVSAHADMVTVTATVPLQTTDFTVAVPSVAAFNHALGTLTSVQISLSASGTFDGNLTNNSASTTDFSLTEFVNFSLTGHSIAALTPQITETQSYTAVPTGTTVPFGPFAPTSPPSGTDTITSGALFDLFNGGGSVSGFVLSTVTGTVVSGGGGNVRTSLTTTAGGVLNVTYNFTPVPVPEPASIALIGLGGAFVLVGSRFRRKMNRDAV